MSLTPEECTEPAFIPAHIRIVDIAVYDKRCRITEQPLPDCIRFAPQHDRITICQQPDTLLLTQTTHDCTS